MITFSPEALAAATFDNRSSSVTTRSLGKNGERESADNPATSSSHDSVAVPNLPTTKPAATLASRVLLSRLSPAESAAAKTAITVSPAPVTSKTSLAFAGRCNGGCPACNRVMPRSLRVINKASSLKSLSNAVPRSIISVSVAQWPTAASNSAKLGVSSVAPV